MINKKNLWFITLFSLIIILGIYYIALPEETITTFSSENTENTATVSLEEDDVIIAMKVEEEEKMLEEINNAQEVLLDVNATVEDKNTAYETLQTLNTKKGKVEKLEKIIKDNFNLESCVKINDNKITVTISSEDQGKTVANNIINKIQEEYDNQMYITVKFQK